MKAIHTLRLMLALFAITVFLTGCYFQKKSTNENGAANTNGAGNANTKLQVNSSECVPLFTLESGPELTASEVYAEECFKQTTQAGCEEVDVYHSLNNNFGNPDGVADCQWISQ